MYLYKDGMVCYADKEQVEYFLADGWSKSKDEVIEDDVVSEDEVIEDDVVSEDDTPAPVGRKISRKKG